MTKTEALAAIAARTLVEAGQGEDHDAGHIIEMRDDATAVVAWQSGVRTPCAIADLSVA